MDVVVNNAGYCLVGPLEELDDEQVHNQMNVNFFAVVAITKKAIQIMREQEPKGGVIQQNTSIAGHIGHVPGEIARLNKHG